MKHLKLLGLLGLVAVSLLLLAGTGVSSATVLCKATATPCESTYSKEAVIHASMSGTAVLTNPEGGLLDECSSGSAEVTINQAGGSTTNVSGSLTSLTWGGCSTTTDTIAKGSMSIDHIAGTDNGTVVGQGTKVTVLKGSFSCTYGSGASGTKLGILRGRKTPVLELNDPIPLIEGSFECPAEAVWRAKYELSEALYVEPGNPVVLCKTASSPCGASYEEGRAVSASLSSSAILESSSGTILDSCTGGGLKGAVATAGGEPETASVALSSLTWTGCNHETATMRVGELDFAPIAGTSNATLTYEGTEVKYSTIFGICDYGGAGGDIGTMKSGEKPTIEVSASLTKSSGGFACPSEVRWKAEYQVEEPTPLYVESS